MLPSESQDLGKPKTENTSAFAGLSFGNLGEPIKLTGVKIDGISAEAAMGGSKVELLIRYYTLSTEAIFHRIAPNIISFIEHVSRQAGYIISLYSANTILLIIKPDETADLWIDKAAMTTDVVLKRGVAAGTAIFTKDIADVVGMWFPLAGINPEDKIVVIFREGFRFGLLFDFNPEKNLDIKLAKRALGTLHRQMRYADLYSILSNQQTFSEMVEAGWFPFIEIMNDEFKELILCIENKFPLADAELNLFSKFDDARLDHMLERWMSKPHFKDRDQVIKSGFRAYKQQDWIACMKVILTEIEGIIAEAYFASTGRQTRRIEKLLEFAIEAANLRAGTKDSLFFPVEFAYYLKNYTYADSEKQTAARNAVGHGRAKPESYTQARALQAILTLDQFAFYS